MAARIDDEMYRGRPHEIIVQLITENDGAVVTALLSTYTHRLIAKLRHSDADASAIFNLTNIFSTVSEGEKTVAAMIPASATDIAALPEGRTTRIYVQWQTTDGASKPWVVADGSIDVKSVLDRTT